MTKKSANKLSLSNNKNGSVDIESTNAFGELLRFWRSTLELSQLTLAQKLETTPRHISFLETGRSQPSREMVMRLATTLELNERETGVMIIAAGLLPESQTLDVEAPENELLKQHIAWLLAKHEPYPAVVLNYIGDIVMSNQAWKKMAAKMAHDASEETLRNVYNLYFSMDGFKSKIPKWTELTCSLLLRLQEQYCLTAHPKLAELLVWLKAYPDVPDNWAAMSKGKEHPSFYDITFINNEQRVESRAVITAIEPQRNALIEQLQMHSYFPLDDETKALWEG